MSETETPDPLVTLLEVHQARAATRRACICGAGDLDTLVNSALSTIWQWQHVADVIRAAGWVQRDERSYLGRHVLERTGMRTRMDDPTEREEQDRG
ncbi:hypothetical protein [Nocardioides bruguierae]|uniref:Uncharacterized protein n=1 Tax=Nocardioides bruguierae TaxID=2945102 RepID=A0A9X2DBD5_9ACTN|nr:hypothetical protein [Nocardioides bruguierae]MCM0622489.1 hypothetical protein [Nocardioides bruguierae]